MNIVSTDNMDNTIILANIGYINNILTNELIGIIIHNKRYFAYYTEDPDLKDIIYIITSKQISNYSKNNNTILAEQIDLRNNSFLYKLSYLLPYPFYINKIIYDKIDLNQIYRIYKEGCNYNDKKNEKIR